MKIKEKQCKNPECGIKFLPIQMLQRCCSPKCESTVVKVKLIEKNERKKAKEKDERKLLMDVAVSVCHSYIRQRDKGKPCISCGEKWNSKFQAGHLFSAGGHSAVRFTEENINGQCPQCNSGSNFDQGKYIEEFEKRYSPEEFEILRSEAYDEKKWTSEELREVIKKYKNLSKTIAL